MSALLGPTPMVRLRLENVFLERKYPKDGYVEAVIDTGYQGFVAVPGSVFDALSMGQLTTVRREVKLADGTRIRSQVGQGTAVVAGPGAEVDGPIEAVPGLSEVLVGTQFLSRFKLVVDYCLRRASLVPCT